MGYAAFVERMKADKSFASWFTPVTTGVKLILDGRPPRRITQIQHALIGLIDHIDPDGTYTPLEARSKAIDVRGQRVSD